MHAERGTTVAPVVVPAGAAVVATVFAVDPGYGSLAGLLGLAAFLWWRRALWTAACAGAWAAVCSAVLFLPGPYDSWAGRAALPVLAGYAAVFLLAWLGGRTIVELRARRRAAGEVAAAGEDPPVPAAVPRQAPGLSAETVVLDRINESPAPGTTPADTVVLDRITDAAGPDRVTDTVVLERVTDAVADEFTDTVVLARITDATAPDAGPDTVVLPRVTDAPAEPVFLDYQQILREDAARTAAAVRQTRAVRAVRAARALTVDARRRGPGRPVLVWPSDTRLILFLFALLVAGAGASYLKFGGGLPPVLAANPDAARQVVREHSSLAVGLVSEAWTVGMALSVLRTVAGRPSGRWFYALLALTFTAGAALGASKNSVLVGIVPGLIAALSVARTRRRPRAGVRMRVAIVLVGVIALGGAVFLGGQRTLAGTGSFENEFRARYGSSPVLASVGSLDLSLSSSAETFGRLWNQRGPLGLKYGGYSTMFLGDHAQPLFGKVDLYAITGQLSLPYYMNTATAVAVPLLDFGALGAVFYLALLGLLVGLFERRLEYSPGVAQQIGRAIVIYFAAFGVYELYPALYPTWLALVPALFVVSLLGRTRKTTR